MEDEDWVTLSWVNRSKIKKETLLYLLDVSEPRTPKEISTKTGTALTHVSSALIQMKENDPSLEGA